MRSNLALSATLALLMLAQVRNAAAQQNLIMVDYSMAFPLGGLEEYIAKNTWRGFAAGYRYMADDNMAVGIDLDWHHFFERKDQASFTLETATFKGTQYRYNNNFAMTAQWDYVFNEGGDLRPYLGVGAGAMYIRRVFDVGLYRFETDDWQFVVQPEFGVSMYLSNGTALNLSANYFSGFKSKRLDGQSYASINLGLIFATD